MKALKYMYTTHGPWEGRFCVRQSFAALPALAVALPGVSPETILQQLSGYSLIAAQMISETV